MKTQDLGSTYWTDILAEQSEVAPLDSWRAFMRHVYLRLLDSWIGAAPRSGGLKTDLFEEAVTDHSLIPHMGTQTVGIDCSLGVVHAARRRLAKRDQQALLVVCDLRRLPLKSGAMRYVLSGSSLDHFRHVKDIATSITELNRVLALGGPAIITFDNPHNPVVWLRNRVPFAWLRRAKLVPYYVGCTPTRRLAYRMLTDAGFEILDVTAVVHAPRVLFICLIGLFEKLHWKLAIRATSSALAAFEHLQRLPTRFVTGYYLAYRLRKRGGG